MNRPAALFSAMALSVAGASGCTPSTLELSRVPNPVMLGPVDRVGGHRAGAAKQVGVVHGEVNDFASATTSTKTVGDTVVTTRETSFSSVQALAVTSNVLAQTEGREDRDVRVDRIPVGAWFLISFGTAMSERWVGLDGRVVEVRHGR